MERNPLADAIRKEVIGSTVEGRHVHLEVDKCQEAMAHLKNNDIPLYEVEALLQNAEDLRAQARTLRQQTDQLEQQAEESAALAKMCQRRDRELASKGMILINGRIRLVDGDNI